MFERLSTTDTSGMFTVPDPGTVTNTVMLDGTLAYDWLSDRVVCQSLNFHGDAKHQSIDLIAIQFELFVAAMREYLQHMRQLLFHRLTRPSSHWRTHLPAWLQNIDNTFAESVQLVQQTIAFGRSLKEQLFSWYTPALVTTLIPSVAGLHRLRIHLPSWKYGCILFYPYYRCVGKIPTRREPWFAQLILLMNLYQYVDIMGPRLTRFQVRGPMRYLHDCNEVAICSMCWDRTWCSVESLPYGDKRIDAQLCETCFQVFELRGNPERPCRKQIPRDYTPPACIVHGFFEITLWWIVYHRTMWES